MVIKRNIYLSLFLVFLFSACVQAQQTPVKIAIIAARAAGLDKSPLVSLLEARLSQEQGIELLERAAIEKILQEQQLSAAGLLERNNTIKAGKLLRADAFVILSLENQTKESGDLIRVRVAETAHGLRLLDRFEELDGKKPEETAERIINEIIAVAGKLNLPAGQAIPIGIVDIHRVQLGERHKLLERALPVLLSVRLSKEPKIIMLEREDLKVLLDEKLLTEGKDSEFWGSAVLIDGYLQSKDGGLEVTLQLGQAGKEIAAFSVAVEPNEPSLAIDKAVNEIIKQLQNSPPSTQWQPELEAEEFYQQGQLLHKHQRYEDAFKLFETAHALQPRNVFYTGSLFMNEWDLRREIENEKRRGNLRDNDALSERRSPCFSDLELAELVSIFVRQIRDGYEKGQLSTRDIHYKWSGSLWRALRICYFTNLVSVATEQIRQINRESRKILIETMDKALRQQLIKEDAPEINRRMRARLTWCSSDDPYELIENLKKAFTESVMPPEMGGKIESPEERSYLYDQAFRLVVGLGFRNLKNSHLADRDEVFLNLWRKYLIEMSKSDDPVVRFNVCVDLGQLIIRESDLQNKAEAKYYAYKAVRTIVEHYRYSKELLSIFKERDIERLNQCFRMLDIEPDETVRLWTEIYEPIIERGDAESLALFDRALRSSRLIYSRNSPQAVKRYYELLDDIADVLQDHKDNKQILRTLTNIRDFQARIRKQFPTLDVIRKTNDLQVTILLNNDDWPEIIRFSDKALQPELNNNMLWIAFRTSVASSKGTIVGLAGIDLDKKEVSAFWQAVIPSSLFPRLTGMVIGQDNSFLSVCNAGIVELPGKDIRGRECFGNPYSIYEGRLPKDMVKPQESDFTKEPRVFTEKDGLPSILITSIAQENDKLWIAYGDRGQESGLGLYDPKTRQWETVFCSTLKGDTPYNAGQTYMIYSLMPISSSQLFFLVSDFGNTRDISETKIGLWQLSGRNRELKYYGPVWNSQNWTNVETFGNKLLFKTSHYFIEFNSDSEKMKLLLGEINGCFLGRYLEKKDLPCELESSLIVRNSSSGENAFGIYLSGSCDLSTAAIHNNKLWARLGESQILIIEKGKSFEDAQIIDNNILEGEPVSRFVSTPYGLIAIGNGTVGLIETESNSN